ncbi:hypothetical protein L0Y26_08600 [Pectobacterium aroidearum]|uniref:Rz1-like lysis system protein LysC n=1 Tax=Pectobacterium aroidearum TaxID=1201031 RepID=UPI002114153C|nr:hypothetical protein [Pectobacterium aroidearum]UUE37955.1 hypothetical protein L0Y26_08600 [Pectobacterium aroidearum]UUE42330.1 hypothetical protein L0Y25_08600 [Pectobacterium aroidearum]
MNLRRALFIYANRYLARDVLLVMFLLTWLTGCGNTRTEYVTAPAVPIPAELLIDCIVPEIPYRMTYGDSVELNERLLTVIDMCNADKAAIRQIESNRASQ